MRAIKISDKSYDYLKNRATNERRHLTVILDLIIEKEAANAKGSVSKNRKTPKGY